MNNGKKSRKVLLKTLIVVGAVLLEVAIFFIVFSFVSQGEQTVPAVKNIENVASSTEATVKNQQETKPEKETESTQPPTQVQTDTEPDTEPQSQTAPQAMISALESAGCSIDSLSAGQLIIVNSQGSSAVIDMYEKDKNGNWSDLELTSYGYVGSNGVDEKSVEGDRKTPYGLFSVGDMFYIDDKPQTSLGSFRITSDTYWVDDPDSAYYNQRVEGTADMDWTSAEHMISYYSSYKYGFVINYNMNPVVPGKGSAIFFHVGAEPTAGCVAVSEYNMLSYLSVLDAAKNPYILIL